MKGIGLVLISLLFVAGCSSDESDASDLSDFNQPSAAATSPTLTGPWTGVEGQRVAVSDVCRQSMMRAAQERDGSRATPLILASLSACSDADEWLSELERQPAVMGLTERADIGRISLVAACGGAPSTPVCVDATARGVRF